MEPPSKRLKLGPSRYGAEDEEEEEDELSMTPAQFDSTQDSMYQFNKGCARSATRLKSTLEDIFEKYGKEFDGGDDVINFYTDEIEVDNGHVQTLVRRKDDAWDGSSSDDDEEDRILNGKNSSGQREKSPSSKSLIPASYAAHNQRLQFHSAWNQHPGLGAAPLSSLAFPSPYGPYPPFELSTPAADPVWQAPDLPVQLVQPRYHQYGPFNGMAGGQFGSFGRLSSLTPKRRMTAKSFRRITSTPSTANTDDTEEDDILLGRSSQAEVPPPRSQDREEVKGPATSEPTSDRPSNNSDQLPSFLGLDLSEDELDTPSNDAGGEEVKNTSTEPAAIATVLTSHQSPGKDKDKNIQRDQTAENRQGLSPSRRKKKPLRESEARKPPDILNKESSSENRTLQPNERRIEIIIPMMKSLPAVEMEQFAEGSALLLDKSPQAFSIERRMSANEDIGVTISQDTSLTSQSSDSHEDVVRQSPASSTEDPEQVTSLSKSKESQKRQSKQTQGHEDFLGTNDSAYSEDGLESTCIETSTESEFARLGMDSFADVTPDCIPAIGHQSECSNEGDSISPDQRLSSIANNNDLAELLAQSAPVTEVLSDNAPDRLTKMSELSTTEGMDLEIAKSQEPQNSDSDTEEIYRDEPSLPSLGLFGEEEIYPIVSLAPDNTTAPYFDEQLKGVPDSDSSEVVSLYENRNFADEPDIGFRSSGNSVVPELTESDIQLAVDNLTPRQEALELYDNHEKSTPVLPACTSVLVTEVDGLRLDSDHPDTQKSPSIVSIELPDEDLSAFPTVPDTHSASDLVLPPPSPPEANEPNSTKADRLPSPELGTPIGSRTTSKTASRSKASPAPTTPTRKQGSKNAKRRDSNYRTPSSKRFPLTSLIPEGIDDESEDELSLASSFSSASSKLFSPFFRATPNDNHDLPPLLFTPRTKPRKHSLLNSSPSSSVRKPNLGLGYSRNIAPATDSRKGRSRTPRGANRAVHSSPLGRKVAERLLSSPTKRHQATPARSPSVVATPNGTLRRCGEDGFECGRDFCFTCCI
ncbi:hypothetical protein F5Y03DRAFT_7209 [Xylaria venustula]|nr:hypothetical protein F5Y03DRAFT_7209 [Xylaria venustula]